MGFLSESVLVGKKRETDTEKCGGICKLNKKCLSPHIGVFGSGKEKILIVDEFPSKDEDRRGVLLTGEKGVFLRGILKTLLCDLDRDCIATTSVQCFSESTTPTFDEVKACNIFLKKTIEESKPTVIIPFGLKSVGAVLQDDWLNFGKSVDQWVGWHIPHRRYNAWVCPNYSLTFLLQNNDSSLLGIFTRHLERALDLKDNPWLHPPVDEKECVEIVKNPLTVKRLLAEASKCGVWAIDYETTGLKPDHSDHRIISCAISNGKQTYAFMMDNAGVQKKVARFMQSSAKKIASNLKFEERWTRAKLGVSTVNWWWDTMLAAHIINKDPGVTSVKFQAFVLLGHPVYNAHVDSFLQSVDKTANGFNQIEKIKQEDLLLYNGLDALLEFRVAEKQMRMLHYPWPLEERDGEESVKKKKFTRI